VHDTVCFIQVKDRVKDKIYSLTFNNRQASSCSCCGCRIFFFLFPFSLFIPALDSLEERVVIVSRWRDVVSQWMSPSRLFYLRSTCFTVCLALPVLSSAERRHVWWLSHLNRETVLLLFMRNFRRIKSNLESHGLWKLSVVRSEKINNTFQAQARSLVSG